MDNENKLPPDFKQKWIDALRSGNYKQGKTMLYNEEEDSFCCLGVACIIAGRKKEELTRATYVGIYEPEYELEPFEGYPSVLIHRQHKDLTVTLAEMNDGETLKPYSFNEIADYIQENL